MSNKQVARVRRAKRTTEHLKKLGVETGVARLCVIKSLRHISAQILSPTNGNVLAHASSMEKEFRTTIADMNKTELAKLVGSLLAKRAQEAGLAKVGCDRRGRKYHGRIAALLDSAREAGLNV